MSRAIHSKTSNWSLVILGHYNNNFLILNKYEVQREADRICFALTESSLEKFVLYISFSFHVRAIHSKASGRYLFAYKEFLILMIDKLLQGRHEELVSRIFRR